MRRPFLYTFGCMLLVACCLILYGCGGDSDIRSIIDLQAPAVVGNVRAVPTDQKIRLLWSANTEPDLVGYNVYRSNTGTGSFSLIGSTGTSQAPFFQDEGPDTNGDGVPDGLINNLRFFYKITAFDRDGRESPLDLSSTVSAVPGTLPLGEADLEVRNVRGFGGDRFAIVSWDLNASSLVFGYEVFRSEVGSDKGFELAGTVPQNVNSFTDADLSPNAEFIYQVAPITRELLEGRRNQSRPLRIGEGDGTVPKPPGHDPRNGAVTATQTANGIRLTWGRPTENTDGTIIGLNTNSVDDIVGGGFLILRGDRPEGFFQVVGILENVGSELGFTFTDVNGKPTDFYFIRAFDTSGNLSAPSDMVSVNNFVPAAPLNVDAFAAASIGQIVVTWQLSAQAVDGYRVFRSERRDDGFRDISGLVPNTVSTFTDTDGSLELGRTFFYKVLAESNGIRGQLSPPAAATPGPDTGIFYLEGEDAAIILTSNVADFSPAQGGALTREAFPDPFSGNGALLIRPSSTAIAGTSFVTLQWRSEIDATGLVPQQVFRSYDVYIRSVRNSSAGIFDITLDEPVTGVNPVDVELRVNARDFFTQNFGFPPRPTMERLGQITFSDEGAGPPNPGIQETLNMGIRYQGFNPAIAQGRGELILDGLVLVRR